MKEVEEARRKVQNQQKQTSMEKVRHEEMLLEEEGPRFESRLNHLFPLLCKIRC